MNGISECKDDTQSFKIFLQQERKRALEAERQARVEELLMKRKEQEARIEQQRQEKEKAREDAARERARYFTF